MNDRCFFFTLIAFGAGIYFTAGSINRNRGNIVNLPTWKKAVGNLLDGLLVSFSLYFILVQRQDQDMRLLLAGAILACYMLLVLAGLLLRLIRRRRLKKRYQRFTVDLELLSVRDAIPRQAAELEYIKCALITFYKYLLVFWMIGYLAGAIPTWHFISTPVSDSTDILYIRRFMTVLGMMTACCILDNLGVILIGREQRQNISPELDRIHRKLDNKINPV